MDSITPRQIIDLALPIVSRAIDVITTQAQLELGMRVDQPSRKDVNNITREVDHFIQRQYEMELGREFLLRYGINVWVTGEEDLRHDGRGRLEPGQVDLVAVLDAVDGTDLVARGFSNWCTALVFGRPGESQVLASLVGLPPGTVYYACASDELSFKKNTMESAKGRQAAPITLNLARKTDKPQTMRDAAICYYGQKAPNFLSLYEMDRYWARLVDLKYLMLTGSESVPLRIYNLAGNPMMVRVADGNVDAVVELLGQAVYDAIPGLYIARKAGAFVGDLEGNEIDDAYLGQALADQVELSLAEETGAEPGERAEVLMRYILASSRALYDDLLSYLRRVGV